MTGNRWYNQIFKYWIWAESKGDNIHSKISMKQRKCMVRTANRKLKQLFKKEIKNEIK